MFILEESKLHSYVDIITNSSTVIYTWSESSVEKAKELLAVMFELFGENDVDIDAEFSIKSLPMEKLTDIYKIEAYAKENYVTLPFTRVSY